MIIPEMPSHNHTMRANGEDAEAGTATGNVLAKTTTATYSGEGADVSMNSASITNTGGGQSFGIIQPFLEMRWCVAMQGIYPSRS